MVRNIHRRQLPVTTDEAGSLLNSLSSGQDRLWPTHLWPAMLFDVPLRVGARGGHGPIRYTVERFTPSSEVQFRFEAPHGFDGYHRFIVTPTINGTELRHELIMRCKGSAKLSWPLLYRPLHDALIEDAFDKASREFGHEPSSPNVWSWRVKRLRKLAARAGKRSAKS